MRSLEVALTIPASITPGATTFTRTPRGPTSAATVRTRETMAPLLAAYAAWPGLARSAATDASATMLPFFCPIIPRSTARMACMVPSRLVATTSRNTSVGVVASHPSDTIPAEVTSSSIAPCLFSTCEKADSTPAASRTSRAITSACPPLA